MINDRRVIQVGFKEICLLMRGLPVDSKSDVIIVPAKDIMEMSNRLDGAEGFRGHFDQSPQPLPKLCDVQST